MFAGHSVHIPLWNWHTNIAHRNSFSCSFPSAPSIPPSHPHVRKIHLSTSDYLGFALCLIYSLGFSYERKHVIIKFVHLIYFP